MWQQLFANYPPSPRVGASLQVANNGKTLVLFGGASHEEGPNNDVFFLDLVQMMWKRMDFKGVSPVDLPSPRYDHCSALFTVENKEKMVIFGGAGEDGPTNDVWIYDIGSNSWTKLDPTGPAPQGRTIQSIGKLHEDDSKGQTRLYLFGGGESGDTPVQDADVYCFDLKLSKWIKVFTADNKESKGPAPRLGHTFIACNHLIYMFGGMSGSTFYHDTWVFDTKTNKWHELETKGVAPSPRSGHSASILDGKKLCIFGGMNQGENNVEIMDDVQVLDLESLTWDTVDHSVAAPPGPPGARLDCAACNFKVTNVHNLNEQFQLALSEKSTEGSSLSSSVMLLFGGMDLSGMFNELFLFDVEPSFSPKAFISI